MSLGSRVHLCFIEFSISHVLFIIVFILWSTKVRIISIAFFIILCSFLVKWGTGYTNILSVVDPFPFLILDMRLVMRLNMRLINLLMFSGIIWIWLLWRLLHENRLVLASWLKNWLDWRLKRLWIIRSVIHISLCIVLSVLWLSIGWFYTLSVLNFFC